MSKTTKKCKYCKEEMDAKASVCPHCQKKQGVGCLVSVLLALTVVLFIIIIAVSCSSSSTSSDEFEEDTYESEIIEETKPKKEKATEEITSERQTEEPTTESVSEESIEETSIEEITTIDETDDLVSQETATESNIKLNSDIIKPLIETSLKQSYGDDMKVEYDELSNNYTIYVWKDGVALGATMSLESDGSEWSNLVKVFENSCTEFKESVNSLDPDAHVTFIVLNDLSLDKSLLTVLDGVTIQNIADSYTKNSN